MENAAAVSKALLGGTFHFRCLRPRRGFKGLAVWLRELRAPKWAQDLVPRYEAWADEARNLVVNEGLNHILDILFNSADSAIVTVDPWYVRLLSASPTVAAANTLGTHAGWTEFTDYTEGAGQEYVGVRTNQTVSNTASKASFSINQDSSSIGGGYLASVSTGTSGILLSGAAFTGGNKAADNGDTLEVTYTFSAADDGA